MRTPMKPTLVLLVGVLTGLLAMSAEAQSPPSARTVPWTRPNQSQYHLNPDSLDLQTDVASLNAEKVRVYRAAIMAKHCQRLSDGPVRREYEEYQHYRCGIRYWFSGDGDEVDNPYSPPDSAFTPAEASFLRKLDDREKALRAGQVNLHGPGLVYDRAAVVNLSQCASLSDSAVQRLLRDGMVTLPARHDQMFHVYEENDYHMVPNFITIDAILHTYHLFFDHALREIEDERLSAAVLELSEGMGQRLHAAYEEAKGRPPQDGLRRAVLYFGVAAMLSRPDSAAAPPSWIDPAWQDDLSTQLGYIRAKDTKHYGPVLGTVDYTMFRPRGHYTRSETLARYFRTMTWLGLPGFILDERHVPLAAGLGMVHVLSRDPELRKLYGQIYDPTRYFIGPTDDITPELAASVADSICGAGASLSQWLAHGAAIREELVRRNPARIQTQFMDDRDLAQIRFLGMRYIPDAEILQRLTRPFVRSLPTGLDLFGVMGVRSALDLLREQTASAPWYWAEMDSLQRQFGDFSSTAEPDNLYRRWIHLLRTVNQPAPAGAAACMHTRPWEYKNLHTSLASWAQLRHDTILYGKQSGGTECGGGETPPRVVGYVEARPDVFGELITLQRATMDAVRRSGLTPRRLEYGGERLEELFTFLQRVSQKEVEGQQVTDQEFEHIRIFGAELENLTRDLLSDRNLSSDYALQGVNQSMATVADVYTNDSDEGTVVLEEGVGAADEIYALVVIDGALYLTRGAVYSYYEFLQPAAKRLTDEEWQKRLRDGPAPPRPGWIHRLQLDEEAKPLVERYSYSSGC